MRPSVTTIILVTQAVCGVSSTDMMSNRRDAPTVMARQVAMYLARRITRQSYPTLGRRFGRDHTTVMHAEARIDQRIIDEPETAELVAAIRASLLEPVEAA